MTADITERYARFIASNSALVVVLVLLLTGAVSYGAVVGDPEDGEIGAFEVDSPESEAAEYVEENYGTEDRVVAQIVVRESGGDVLTRESLLDSLEFQQELRDNESINETLAADDPIIGVENVVAITAITDEQVAELEQRGAEIEQRNAALEERSDRLEAGIDEVRELQREYEELSLTFDEDDPEHQAGSAAIEDDIDDAIENATADFEGEAAEEFDETANLSDEQVAEYEAAAEQARMVESQLFALGAEETAEQPETDPGELEEDLGDVYTTATVGVLEAEFAQLETDSAQLEADQAALEEDDGQPPLEDQIEAIEERDEAETEALLETVLDPDADAPGGDDPYELLPEGYEPGETSSDARLTLLFQEDESGDDEPPEAAYDAQVEIAELLEERFDDAFLFGEGVTDEASSQAVGDSFAIITPVALVLVLGVLGVAYRDVVDVILAIGGIGVVMAWLVGIMGWLEIPMNQILIAVPFLLVGLGIDYALHVVMRYREARAGTLEAKAPTTDEPDSVLSVRTAMAVGLGSVVLALAAATFSTGVGFLSNVVSPLPAIQDFAVLSAGGILATFVAFGVFLPAVKTLVDSGLENRLGRSRRKPAFGVETGGANAILARIAAGVSRAPIAVILVAGLLATGGAVGATTIDTEFNEADFLPEDPPEWTENLPGSLEPGTYTISDDLEYLSDNFRAQAQGGESQVLVRGEPADGETLRAMDTASNVTEENTTIQFEPDGTPAIEGPHTLVRELANDNETVASAVEENDTTGDGLPDENVTAVYELAFDADEEATSEVLSRDDNGEITSARLLVSVRSDESAQAIASDTRGLAAGIEDDATGATAVATSGVVTTAVVQDALLESLVQAFAVTIVVILAFLTALFWVRYRSASQGLLTLLPVVMALCWLLGAMAVLDVPFNSETAVITSLAIGLGVDYSIHAAERFMTERERLDSLEEALERTITGTGGALLASAATTAAGFGVLALALAPPLQRFGIVTGISIVLAFVACVTVLPCLLVVRERFLSRRSQN